MHIKIQKEKFLKALSAVTNIISQRPTLPILANVLLETNDTNTLILTGTDMEIAISKRIEATVQEEGSITIPAKKLLDIARELPTETVEIAVSRTNSVSITSGKAFIKLLGLGREDFPTFPAFNESSGFEISLSVLQECIRLTSFAVSNDENKYVLNGMLFTIQEGVLKIVSTDGRRLAYISHEIPQAKKTELHVIIPAKTIHEISRVVPENENEMVRIISLKNQVVFKFANGFVISRLIEGHFPDYEKVIPPTAKKGALVERNSFLSVLRRAYLLTSKEAQGVKLDFLKDKILVTAKSPNLGELKEEIDVTNTGGTLSIGFNPLFLIDVLKNMDDDKVLFTLTDVDKPGVIRKENGDYLCVIMPMQIG